MKRPGAAAITARKGTRFATVTAYDAAFARIAVAAGIDVLLVGDSLGNVVLGYPSTTSVDLIDMVRHTGAVVRGAPEAHVIADLPFGSYEASDELAVASAVTLIKAGASSVKLEGGGNTAPRIRAIVDAGIPVCAHIGVLPQTAGLGEGFRRRRNHEALVADAQAVTEAGAFAVVLEMVDEAIAAEITRDLAIPTIGIGSGAQTDAQIIVLYDVLGLHPTPPPFVKPYADLAAVVGDALKRYAADAIGGRP